jgi:hypothetical protein
MKINELFGLDKPNEGDALIYRLIEIIKNDNVEVEKNPNGRITFKIDDQDYMAQTSTGVAFLGGVYIKKMSKTWQVEVGYKISIKYWYELERIAKKQELDRRKSIMDNELDKLDDTKRIANKYNL